MVVAPDTLAQYRAVLVSRGADEGSTLLTDDHLVAVIEASRTIFVHRPNGTPELMAEDFRDGMGPCMAHAEEVLDWFTAASAAERSAVMLEMWECVARYTRLRPRYHAVTSCMALLHACADPSAPIPSAPPLRDKIAVLIPTNSPRILMSAPPELPGLMAASV